MVVKKNRKKIRFKRERERQRNRKKVFEKLEPQKIKSLKIKNAFLHSVKCGKIKFYGSRKLIIF